METLILNGLTAETFRTMIREEVMNALGKIPDSTKKYYTRTEVADLLRVSLPTIHRLMNDGMLQGCKVGGRTLFDAESVDGAVREKKIFRYQHRKA